MTANYDKPTVQKDLEERQKDDYVSPSVLAMGTDPVPSEDGFVGVDAVYRNFANETDKPYIAPEDSAEGKVEASAYAEDVDTDAGATPKGDSETEDDEDEDDEDLGSQSSGFPTTPSSPQL